MSACYVCDRAFPDHDTMILHLVEHPGRTADELAEAARIRAERERPASDPAFVTTAWPDDYVPPALKEIE